MARFRHRLAGGGNRLLLGRGDPLARLAADDVAEGVLEALGAAAGGESLLRSRLLGGIALAVASTRPRRVRLAEPGSAVDRDREDEEADPAVHQALLGEADRHQGEEEQRAGDAGGDLAG